jgi:hypothetical protein
VIVAGRTIRWTDERVDAIGAMLDDVRDEIVAARRRGQRPEVLVVPPAVYDALVAAKQREVRRGIAVHVLGLRLQREPDR